MQCLLESSLSFRGEIRISSRIDKDTGAVLGVALEFREHIEVSTVGSEKYVTGQTSQHGKCMLEILNDARVTHGWPGVETKWYSDQKLAPPTITIFRVVPTGSPCR